MKTALLSTVLLSACATTLDPNYALQMQTYADLQRTQLAIAQTKAEVETQRYLSIARIAEASEGQAKMMAVLALALGAPNGTVIQQVNQPLPAPPESQEQRAWKLVAFALPVVSSLAQSYFGYRLGVAQTNAQRDTTMAGFGALGALGRAGFNSNDAIAAGAFTTVRDGKPQAPTIFNIGGDGVIGDGTFTGPYSGTNSGNSGRINSPNDDHSTNLPPTPSP